MKNRNRIVGLNGEPIGNPEPPKLPEPPRNLPELVEEARRLYEKRDERKAFHKLCDAVLFCSQGVARNMNDAGMLLQQIRGLQEQINALGEKITPK